MKVFKSNSIAPDYIPLGSKRRPLVRNQQGSYSSKPSTKMSNTNGNKKMQSRYAGILDRNLVPRVRAYLSEQRHLRYVDVEQMADELQACYSDYGRKKKIPFRQMVNQAYEEVRASQPVVENENDSVSEPEEAPIMTRDPANESLRSMYTSVTKDLDDIMVIDVTGDRQTTSSPIKKKMKRKKEEEGTPAVPRMLRKSSRITVFQPVVSETRFSQIGGNQKSLSEVRKLILHMKHPEVYGHLGLAPPRGFLLHGPPGCGKTLLAHAIAGELGMPFFKVAATELVSGVSGESEEQIRGLFDQAVAAAPCIVFIDEIDAITPKRETAQREMERRIVAQLLSCLDDLGQKCKDNGAGVLVIGATNRADSLDPALRRAGRFDREISLGIPDAVAREQILKVVCQNLNVDPEMDWKQLASSTPGYVGADMLALASEAGMIAAGRLFKKMEEGQPTRPESTEEASWAWLISQPAFGPEDLQSVCIHLDDFLEALKAVQPSAQREGFATVPDVTWKDIGALASVRRELNLAILAPIRYSDHYEALGMSSPSGILLCGPPGCGKTLLAKAVANEAGINFISVKGPELLNMYVGESERAVRTVFERARNSAPCVIFFDELDALCPRRSEHSEGGATRVVNQLLTEMDGLEARRGVFLMAATNRPDIIDPAVLRPGRLDKILHVGFPSAADRVDILRALTKDGHRPRISDESQDSGRIHLLDRIGSDARLDGYTGADLASLVKEAATLALQEFVFGEDGKLLDATPPASGSVAVHERHFQAAIEKIRPSVSPKDRKHYEIMLTRHEL